MRYVRTEYRIIDTANAYVPCRIVDGCVDFDRFGRFGIIKQANAVEELCDEFVLCGKGRHCVIGDVEAREMSADKAIVIYGAIWTEWGLRYVAKMNEEGELELL